MKSDGDEASCLPVRRWPMTCSSQTVSTAWGTVTVTKRPSISSRHLMVVVAPLSIPSHARPHSSLNSYRAKSTYTISLLCVTPGNTQQNRSGNWWTLRGWLCKDWEKVKSLALKHKVQLSIVSNCDWSLRNLLKFNLFKLTCWLEKMVQQSVDTH